MATLPNGKTPSKVKTDQYVNKAYGSVTMSAANTLTFEQIQMPVGLFQGVALIIHRLLWWPQTTPIREMVAATDAMYLALTSSNRLTTITAIAEPAIIAQTRLIGVGANVEAVRLPWVTDFTSLPGGGKIVAANPLYYGMFTGGFAAAGSADLEIEFTFVELNDRDYLELIQNLFPANL